MAPSLHARAKIDEHLVGGLKADQTFARKLDIEHYVDEDYRDDREPENVEPTPMLAA